MKNKGFWNKKIFQNIFIFESSILTFISIALMSIYYIKDFINRMDYLASFSYFIVLGVCIYMVLQKKEYYKTIGIFMNSFVICWIIKNGMKFILQTGWLTLTLEKLKIRDEIEFFPRLFDVYYSYIYVICIVFAISVIFVKDIVSKNVSCLFKSLGIYSCIALALQFFMIDYIIYSELASIIFVVSAIYAFISAYYDKKVDIYRVFKAIGSIFVCCIAILLFTEKAMRVMNSVGSFFTIDWYYLVGIIVLAFVAILTKESNENNMFGISVIASFIYLYYIQIMNIVFSIDKLLFLHILAILFYKMIESMYDGNQNIDQEKKIEAFFKTKLNRQKSSVIFFYVISYTMSFIIIASMSLYLFPVVITAIPAILILIVYYFGFKDIEATFYDLALFGATPWIFLEVTLYALGKLSCSLMTAVIMTVIFWIIAGIGLAWRNSFHIPILMTDIDISKNVVRFLAFVPYILILISLCQGGNQLLLKEITKAKKEEVEFIEISLVPEVRNEEASIDLETLSYQWNFGQKVEINVEGEETVKIPIQGKFLKVEAEDSAGNQLVRYFYE